MGTVVALWRHPVKSFGGERLDVARVTAEGVAGDRRVALRDGRDGRLLSAKREPRLLLASAATTAGGVVVTLPDGLTISVTDRAAPAALSAWLGYPVTVALGDRAAAFVDDAPVHLASTASLAAAATTQAPLRCGGSARRSSSRSTAARRGGDVAGAHRRGRCGATRGDGADGALRHGQPPPTRGAADAGLLRRLAAGDDPTLGVYADVDTPGEVRVGDPVRLDDAAVATAR